MAFIDGDFFSPCNYIPIELQEIITSYIDTRNCSLCGTVVSRITDNELKFKCEKCDIGLYQHELRGWRCVKDNENEIKESSRKGSKRRYSDSILFSNNIYGNIPDIFWGYKKCNRKVKHGKRKCHCVKKAVLDRSPRYIQNFPQVILRVNRKLNHQNN